MGQGSSGPVTAKASGDEIDEHSHMAWAHSDMQGWRDGMEDAHLSIRCLGEHCGAAAKAKGWGDTALFGVMDGHGGEQVARYCERHLPGEICKGSPDDIPGSMLQSFHRMDEMLRDPDNLSELRSMWSTSRATANVALKSWFAHPDSIGATAVLAIVRPDRIVVANVGDSRAVLCRGGRVEDLSEDHKPNMPRERERIARAGGVVEVQHFGPITQYRVNGGLNLSRSIGDLAYKRNRDLPPPDQLISATPDVRTFKRQATDEFMVICCDGIWDVLSSQEVVEFVRARLGPRESLQARIEAGHLKLSHVLEDLLDTCLSPDLQQTYGLGGDNMTAVLVCFLSTAGSGQAMQSYVTSELSMDMAPSWLCSYRQKSAC